MTRMNLLGSSALRTVAIFGLGIGLVSPALAQDADQDPVASSGDIATVEELPQATAQPSVDEEEIVVTGSRIRRSAFTSPDPITIIDPALAQAQGQLSTAEMIQSSTIAAGSSQVTSAISSAFVTNGGPGAETISLRGLGAERTLVLLNGRRAGPAGTRGAISAFDLNVLPQSIVQSVEILKTGASSVYGSDAIAGVVNLITKKDTDGVELDAFVSLPLQSGGEQYRLSATWGKDFGRGHFLASFDYFKRENFQRRDRDYLECPEEYIFRPNGSRADLIDPRTGQYRCNELPWGHVWVYNYQFTQVSRFQYDYAGDNLGAHIPLRNPARPWNDLVTPPGFYHVGYDRASSAVDNYYHPMYGNESVIPETQRYTAYVDASYEVTDTVRVGTELLFNRRETNSTSFRQFWYLTGFTQEFEPGFGDPFSEGWEGPYWISPTAITDHNSTSQRVDYYRALGWVDGKLAGDWNFNGYLQYSKSEGRYISDVILKDSVDLVNYRTSSCVGTTTPIGNRPCVDFDWTRPGFLAGDLTDAERAYLFDVDEGNTDYSQWAGELSATGSLFSLPWVGREVQAAIGVAYRRDEINDVPGEITRAGNSWGLTAAGITAGHVDTKEAFAELEIPLLRDVPGIQEFTLSGSGRVTNVTQTRSSDGFTAEDNGNWTYSIGANWQVTDFLRFRARYGTSFRAPALFELFLADQTSFLSQRQVDPCIGYGLPDATQNERVKANCAAAGIPGDHSGAGPSATIYQGGGIGVVEPETSTAKSVSVVLTPSFAFLPNTRFNVAVDYFDIDIRGEIATLGANSIISGCYNSEFFPDEPLCDLFTRLPAGVGGQYNIDEVRASFININRQRNRGIDVTANVVQGLGSLGSLSFLAQMTWQIEDEVALFTGTTRDDTGEAGEPRWVGDFNLVWKPDNKWSFFYGLDVIGATSDEQDYIDIVGDLCRTTATYGEYCVDLKAEARFYHSLSATVSLDYFDITAGVSNLLNTKPPRVTVAGGNSLNQGTISTIGQSVFASQYDYLGRRLFVNIKSRF